MVAIYHISLSSRYSTHQIQGRWNILVTLYRQIVQHNSHPVNKCHPLTMAYQEAMEAVYKYISMNNTKTDKAQTKEMQEENRLQRQDMMIKKSIEVPAR